MKRDQIVYLVYSIHGPTFYIVLVYWPESWKHVYFINWTCIEVAKNATKCTVFDTMIISAQATAVFGYSFLSLFRLTLEISFLWVPCWSTSTGKLVWVTVCCPSWRTFARKSPGPRHPGAGMVTIYLRVSLVLQEKNKSALCFSTTQDKIKIMVNLRPLNTELQGTLLDLCHLTFTFWEMKAQLVGNSKSFSCVHPALFAFS